MFKLADIEPGDIISIPWHFPSVVTVEDIQPGTINYPHPADPPYRKITWSARGSYGTLTLSSQTQVDIVWPNAIKLRTLLVS